MLRPRAPRIAPSFGAQVKIFVAGAWKTGTAYVRVAGAWVQATRTWIQVGGVWK